MPKVCKKCFIEIDSHEKWKVLCLMCWKKENGIQDKPRSPKNSYKFNKQEKVHTNDVDSDKIIDDSKNYEFKNLVIQIE